jgi:soluble lytic murein transglycosylase
MLAGENQGGKYSKIRIYRTLLYGIFVAICLVATGVSMKYYTLSQLQNNKIGELERVLHELRGAMNVDTIRQYSIQKVIAIIDRFNPTMESSLKYEIANTIYEMSVKYRNLDIDLICATITHESGRTWNPEVMSHAGAMGLMQVMPMTGMYVASDEGLSWTTPEDVLYNPILNIRLGCRYLSSLITEYDLDGGLAAYNGGERRAAMWVKANHVDGILWDETQRYIPSVKKLYTEYRQMTM